MGLTFKGPGTKARAFMIKIHGFVFGTVCRSRQTFNDYQPYGLDVTFFMYVGFKNLALCVEFMCRDLCHST